MKMIKIYIIMNVLKEEEMKILNKIKQNMNILIKIIYFKKIILILIFVLFVIKILKK